ncbi:hypothetical protein C7S17_2405 [Burkholderia thailandensis]|nr:hypothetical protein [Burkholderia thailandensis]
MRIGMAESAASTSRDIARPRAGASRGRFHSRGNISAPHAELAEPRAAAATTLSNSPPDRMSFYIWN